MSARLGWWCYETTTPITEGTYAAARSAVDVALSAAAAVLAGEPIAYGLCRPPGHHAATDAVRRLLLLQQRRDRRPPLHRPPGSRVAVLDVDYHHGNGTQQIFYERDDVAFVSLHGDPRRAYPYHTGFADETGSGRGSGSTTNIPLAAGTDDEAYLGALDRALDADRRVRPGVVVVSLGVDTFGGDPICDLAITTEGFRRCGAAVAARGRPLVVLQEGGYAGDALGANVVAWLTGASPPRLLIGGVRSALIAAITAHQRSGRCRAGSARVTAGDDVAVALGQAAGDVFRLGDDGERRQHLVVDELAHRRPVAGLGEPVELGLEVAPAVQVEHGPVRGRRTVEGDLLAHRLLGCRPLGVVCAGDDEARPADLEAVESLAGLRPAACERRQRHLTEVALGGERDGR